MNYWCATCKQYHDEYDFCEIYKIFIKELNKGAEVKSITILIIMGALFLSLADKISLGEQLVISTLALILLVILKK